MKKIISYPLSILYYLFFSFFLLFFHPIQWLCLKLGGYLPHKKSVDYLNFFLVNCLRILGTKISFNQPYELPKTPLIIVSNHQSMYDVPPFIWYLRKHHVKFISKKELGSGIPSISFNLKHGGSILIDRNDRVKSIEMIKEMGDYLEKNNYSVVIFPEGTRSRNGIPKKFKSGGLKSLVENVPSAHIIPVSVNNTWKITRYGVFPLSIRNKISFDIHPAIKVSEKPFEQVFEQVEKTIKEGVIITA